MKKSLLFIIVLPCIIQALTPQRARQLRQEFQQVGIYDPENPEQYDASRADQIINELEKGGFGRRAQELKLTQAESRSRAFERMLAQKERALQAERERARQARIERERLQTQLARQTPAQPAEVEPRVSPKELRAQLTQQMKQQLEQERKQLEQQLQQELQAQRKALEKQLQEQRARQQEEYQQEIQETLNKTRGQLAAQEQAYEQRQQEIQETAAQTQTELTSLQETLNKTREQLAAQEQAYEQQQQRMQQDIEKQQQERERIQEQQARKQEEYQREMQKMREQLKQEQERRKESEQAQQRLQKERAPLEQPSRPTEDKGKGKQRTQRTTGAIRPAAVAAQQALRKKQTEPKEKKWQDVSIYLQNKSSTVIDVWAQDNNGEQLKDVTVVAPATATSPQYKLPFTVSELKGNITFAAHGDVWGRVSRLAGMIRGYYSIDKNSLMDVAQKLESTGSVLVTIKPNWETNIATYNPEAHKITPTSEKPKDLFARITVDTTDSKGWPLERYLREKPHFILDISKDAPREAKIERAQELKRLFTKSLQETHPSLLDKARNALDAALLYSVDKQPEQYIKMLKQGKPAYLDLSSRATFRFGDNEYQMTKSYLPGLIAPTDSQQFEDVAENTQQIEQAVEQAKENIEQKEQEVQQKLKEFNENPALSKTLSKDEFAKFTEAIERDIFPEGWCGQEYEQNGTILLYTIHGTWSSKNAFGGNIRTISTYNIFRFACQLAQEKQQRVKVISVSWSGSLNRDDREEQAKALATECEGLYTNTANNIKEVWMIGHSHGCNVALMAANRLYEQNILPDTAVLMAPPFLQEPEKGVNFKTVYAFWSQGDFTQMAGSMQLGLFTGQARFDRKIPIATEPGKKVYNIRTKLNGYDLDHISIKWAVMPFLADILHTINTYYPHYFDLEMNVVDQIGQDGRLEVEPMIAIRRKKGALRPELRKQIDAISLAKDKEARQAYSERYPGDISDIGVRYLSGLTWLANLIREMTTKFTIPEPRIPEDYLHVIRSNIMQPTPTSSQAAPSDG